MSVMRVDGKVALVSGAGSGIGKATALRLASEGAYVAVTDIDHSAACDVASAIVQSGMKGFAWELDVCDKQAWQSVLEEVSQVSGKLDILVNNAGIAVHETFEETTLDDWERVRSINLDSIYIACKTALPYLSNNASIINVSSIAGLVAVPNGSAYCATKGGARLLTKGLAVELARANRGVRVNSVHPGAVNTALLQEVVQKGGDEAASIQAFTDMHPMGRLAEPEEIAAGILFLASDESSFMTGSELVIDGGYTAQ